MTHYRHSAHLIRPAAATVLLLAIIALGCTGPTARTRLASPNQIELTALDRIDPDALERASTSGPAEATYRDAILGDPFAQRRLGMMFAAGIGVPRNTTAAVDWLLRAAEQRDCAAQYELGLIYLGGRGVPYDIKEAAYWLRKAVDHQSGCSS